MALSREELIDQIGNMTVLELAELVKSLEDTFGVSAAMPVAAAPVASAEAGQVKQEEKSEYKVELVESGPKKIATIKALRSAVSSLGLTEAKKAVEEAPTVIAESAPKAEAEKMKAILEESGAKVKLS